MAVSRLLGWGGHSVKCWVGVCHPDTEILTLSAAHTHTAYRWVYLPWALKCLHLLVDQKELFNFNPNVLSCIPDVWQGFIPVLNKIFTLNYQEILKAPEFLTL